MSDDYRGPSMTKLQQALDELIDELKAAQTTQTATAEGRESADFFCLAGGLNFLEDMRGRLHEHVGGKTENIVVFDGRRPRPGDPNRP